MSKNLVLIHGLARSSRSMQGMERFLCQNGFECHNFDYPSRKFDIATLAIDVVLPQIKGLSATPDFYVTHSMGGLILRFLLENQLIRSPKAIVMLSPPNAGSEIVDKIGHWYLFGLVNGQAGRELGTQSDSVPSKLNRKLIQSQHFFDTPVGIISGTKSLDPFQLLLPSQNDGKVTVKSSQLTYMTDFLTVPVAHTMMMNKRPVQEQTLNFLNYHKFMH